MKETALLSHLSGLLIQSKVPSRMACSFLAVSIGPLMASTQIRPCQSFYLLFLFLFTTIYFHIHFKKSRISF